MARSEAVGFGRRQQGLRSSHYFRGAGYEKLIFSNISAYAQRYNENRLTDFALDHYLVAHSSSHFQSHCLTTRCRHSKRQAHYQSLPRTLCWLIVAARCWMYRDPTQMAQGDCSWSAAESVSSEDLSYSMIARMIAMCKTYR